MARILILEDDIALSGQMTEMLRQEGHEVTEFAVTGQAVSYLADHEVDLLIVDLFIKDKLGKLVFGGISLISQVRQIMRLDVPIVAISGAFNSEIKLEAMQTSSTVGADKTVAKPFHPDELAAAVDELLAENDRPSKSQAL